jgi:hypothetical protein
MHVHNNKLTKILTLDERLVHWFKSLYMQPIFMLKGLTWVSRYEGGWVHGSIGR